MHLRLFSYLLLIPVIIDRVIDMICTGSCLVKATVHGCTCMCMSLLKLALQKIEVKLKRNNLKKYCTRYCKQWRSKDGKWGYTVLSAGFGGASKPLQTFKNTLLSRISDQIILNNALFFKKVGKISSA